MIDGMADDIVHINAGATLTGACMTNTIDSKGNSYGNGNSTVKFSKAAIANLPGIISGASAVDLYRVVAWETVPAASLDNLPDMPTYP